MKKLNFFRAFMAIAVMFFMTTSVFAQGGIPGNLVFQVSATSGQVPAEGAALASSTISAAGNPEAWVEARGLLFTTNNEGSGITPGNATPNINNVLATLTPCLSGITARGRIGQGTNLYTFRFDHTTVASLTILFYAGNNANANELQIASVRTGANRDALTPLADFSAITFTSYGVTHANWEDCNSAVTIPNINVPAGTYIEVRVSGGNTMFAEAVVTPMPTGEPSLFIDRIVVAETDLPEATFTGAGPFTYLLQRTAIEMPSVSIFPSTPDYVTVTAAQGLFGTFSGHQIDLPSDGSVGISFEMPDGVYTDTIVFRLTGTTGAIDGETATFLVVFQKDTVDIRTAEVGPSYESPIPAEGNIVVTFNKDVFVIDGVGMDEIVTINAAPGTVTLVGRALTIPYVDANWDNNLEMQVVILANTLRDAVLEPNAEIVMSFEQNVERPEVTGANVGGVNLQGATGLQTSFTVNLEFNRMDVVHDPAVAIQLNGVAIPEGNIVGTTIELSGLNFATTYTLYIPVGAFVVEANPILATQASFTANFTTDAFRVPLAGYRSITGGNFRAMRRIENDRWARGEHAYSGDSVWFFRYDETVGFHPHPVNTGTEGFTPAGNGLFETMLSPIRFSGGTQASYLPFDDDVDFMETNPQKIRMMHNGARQFIFRAGSTDVAEIALNMIHNTQSQAAGSFAATFISEIVISNDRIALIDNDPYGDAVEFFETVEFTTTPVEIRGSGSIPANGGAFMLVADLNEIIPQGSFIRLTIDGGQNPAATNPGEPSNQVLVEALFTPSAAFLTASYTITTVTNVATGVALNQAMPTDFVASVNFGSNALVMRNADVAITLNNVAIDAEDISHTFITFEDLADETVFELFLPEGAWVSTVNAAWVSPAQTITFRTGQEPTSVAPGIVSETSVVSIFPNPVSDILYVTAENMQLIEIMDMLGRTVLTRATNNSRESVDVSGLREGLYFIRITKTTGEIVVMRFVKN